MLERYESLTDAADRLADVLSTELQGWLTTVDPDGTPQPTTMWFLPLDDSIVLWSRPGAPKLRNLETHGRVAFHLNSERSGRYWVVMTGTAIVDPSLPRFDRHPEVVEKYGEAMEQWGFDADALADAYSVPIRMTPASIRIRVP